MSRLFLIALILFSPRFTRADDLPVGGDDYALMWWADGFQGRAPNGQWRRVVQTNHYAAVLDVDRMTMPHFGRIAEPRAYAVAARHDNTAWESLPPAQLDLEIEVEGVKYRCTHGGRPTLHDGPRIIESGRFVERTDVTNLELTANDGAQLPVEARFEMLAWPDRFTLSLDAFPRLLPVSPGDTFGRVGGGFGLDGLNHLELPVTESELPATFTLGCWVYVPVDFFATQYDAWVLCLGANEWVEGHVGIVIGRNGVPRAVLDIGGGRDNCTMLAASVGGRPRALETERWHQLTVTYDGTRLVFYVDGQAAGAQTVGKPRQPVAAALAVGRRGDNAGDGYHFRGVLDEIRVYDRALSASDVARLAAQPEVALDAAPERAWSFDTQGTARAERPAARWENATLTLRLRTDDQTYEQQAVMPGSEPWAPERPGHVAVAIDFGSDAPSATDGDNVHPAVSVTASDAHTGAPVPVTFDHERGWIRLDLNGVVKQGDDNNRQERIRLQIDNPTNREQPVRLLFDKTLDLPITGMSAVLCDRDGYPIGIPVQLSKNWHRIEQRLLYEGPWFHGFTYARVAAKAKLEWELVLAGAHWGGVAAASHAQLCLVAWGSNQLWNQSAIGSWGESFCFEPDRAQANALVCDVRPLMVHAMNRDEPTRWTWTNNVGGGDLLRLFAPDGTYVRPTGMKTAYLRQGPCLTEVVYAGTLADGAATHHVTTHLYRTDDVARCMYQVRLDVHDPIAFSRFVILQIGADTYGYTRERQMAIGHAAGLVREWKTQWGGDTYRTEPMRLEGSTPWVSLHDAESRDPSKSGAWANRGLVIRSWRARLGGLDCGPCVAERGVGDADAATSTADILPPPGVQRLEPGDFIDATIEHIVVPQFARDYYGPNDNLRHALERYENTWHMIDREARGNELIVEASLGDVERTRPVVVRAANDRAEFSVTGGKGYFPLTIRGLSTFRAPCLEIRSAAGDWQVVDQSTFGNDFWQTNYDAATGTWDITFTIPGDTPDDSGQRRELRFVARGD